jgi:hypothetical protein
MYVCKHKLTDPFAPTKSSKEVHTLQEHSDVEAKIHILYTTHSTLASTLTPSHSGQESNSCSYLPDEWLEDKSSYVEAQIHIKIVIHALSSIVRKAGTRTPTTWWGFCA